MRFVEIDAASAAIAAKGVGVISIAKCAEVAHDAHAILAGLKGRKIEGAEAHPHMQTRGSGLDGGYGIAQKAGAVFKAAAIFARAVKSGEQFMPQIPVTMFDVDKIETGFVDDDGGATKIFDQAVNVVVTHQGAVGHMKALVEQGVFVGRHLLKFFNIVRFAPAARVGELQADHQIIGAAKLGLMFIDQRFAQMGQCAQRLRVGNQLVGVGAAIVPHRYRLAAPHQLGPACAKALPAANG